MRNTSTSTRINGHSMYLLLITLAIALTWVSKPSNAVFLSIDCGGSESFTDQRSISWVGDEGYVRNGDSQLVEFSSSKSTVVSTLRAFPTLNKNCYTIGVEKGERLLARASFFYGNYDGKDSPPTFNVYFDDNFWTRVNMSSYSEMYVGFEVIYTARANTTRICLVRSRPNQIPFITALELRSLDANMYSHVDSNSALFMEQRYSQGTNQNVRYPDDAYDRIWYPGYILGSIDVENEATKIDATAAEDIPPIAVLRNANTLNTSTSTRVSNTGIQDYISISTGLPAFKVPIYMNLYFSEVTLLPSKQKRSFQLYIDGDPYSKPIIPPFGSVQEVSVTNITASSITLFELRPTSDSTLPPLINANEVFSIGDALPVATDGKDVEGLAALQMQFQVLQKWSGDPCLPANYTWEWVECSSDAIPRVTAVNLSSFGLFGALPDFSSMDALITLDLHNNSINGPIPDFLGSFPELKHLDLSENRFNGTVPTSLSKNKTLKLVITENCLAGMSCPPPPSEVSSAAPPPRGRTPSSSETDDDYNPPPPPSAFYSSQDRKSGNEKMPFLSGSKRSLELVPLVLKGLVQFFSLGLLFNNFF